jgi:hypothetical protein
VRRALILALAATALTTAAARAQTPTPANAPMTLDDNTALFCASDTGDIRPMTYANLGVVVRRYAARFNFKLSVQGPPLTLVFSSPADTPYSVTYKAQPYTDDIGHKGVLIQSMHLFLDNADRDITGTPMCYFTEFGK